MHQPGTRVPGNEALLAIESRSDGRRGTTGRIATQMLLEQPSSEQRRILNARPDSLHVQIQEHHHERIAVWQIMTEFFMVNWHGIPKPLSVWDSSRGQLAAASV